MHKTQATYLPIGRDYETDDKDIASILIDEFSLINDQGRPLPGPMGQRRLTACNILLMIGLETLFCVIGQPFEGIAVLLPLAAEIGVGIGLEFWDGFNQAKDLVSTSFQDDNGVAYISWDFSEPSGNPYPEVLSTTSRLRLKFLRSGIDCPNDYTFRFDNYVTSNEDGQVHYYYYDQFHSEEHWLLGGDPGEDWMNFLHFLRLYKENNKWKFDFTFT